MIPARLLVIVALAAGQDPESVEPAPTTAPGYAPEGACTACHRSIAESYAEVGMGRSFHRFDARRAVEDFKNNQYFHRPSNRHYEMTLEDGRLWITRFRRDDAGQRYAVRRQSADYVVGSGNHSRGYMYRLPSGELFQLPIVWYVQEGRWGMAPGFDRADHEDFDRAVTRQCMFCHNAYPPHVAGSDAFGQPHRFPAELPHGIGCQRCHGPGAEHVRLALDAAAPEAAVRDSIVNPVRLPAGRRDDVCLQCHLQPTSLRTSFVRRFGRGDYSFKPGEALDDYLVHVDVNRAGGDGFEINHHPYRLAQSRCFQASDGALSCLTCHDPHRKVPATDRVAHYRAACLTCHAPTACGDATTHAAPDADCAGCHMPQRRTDDVVHVVMTDHLIQRIPRPGLTAMRPESPSPAGPARPYRQGADQADLYAALATAADYEPGSTQALSESLARSGSAAVEAHFQLGLGHVQAGELDAAGRVFDKLVRTHPGLVPARVNLGRVLAAGGAASTAVQHLVEAVRLDPDLAEGYYNLGVLLRRHDAKQSETLYRKALELRPSYANAALNLGNLVARRGGYAEAIDHFQTAIASNPDLATAYVSLGAALRRLDRWPEAIVSWERGLAIRPPSPRLYEELIVTLLTCPQRGLRDSAKARRLAGRARAAWPTDGDVLLAHALVLAAAGERAEAERAVNEALASHADPMVARWIQTLAAGGDGAGLGDAPPHRVALAARDLVRERQIRPGGGTPDPKSK